MKGAELILDTFERNKAALHREFEDITPGELASEPHPSITWLAWHLVRVQDVEMAKLAGRCQTWIVDGWHDRFGMPSDPQDYGPAHTQRRAQVSALQAEASLLLAYHDTVHGRSAEFLAGLSDDDLDRVLDEPRFQPLPTVGVRLVSVINDNIQHVGQIMYQKACLRAGGWFPNPRPA